MLKRYASFVEVTFSEQCKQNGGHAEIFNLDASLKAM
jgi:hypothetical protein